MGHLRQIVAEDFSYCSLTKCQWQTEARLAETAGVEHRANADHRRLVVRYLHSDSSLARNRRDDPDASRLERQCDIIGKRFDLRDLDSCGGHKFVERDDRAWSDGKILDLDIERRELLLQDPRVLLQLLVVDIRLLVLRQQ